MNNLLRYLKLISTIGFWIVFLIILPSKAHSFDFNEPVITVTNFLDSLSYNYKGFDIKLKQISVGEEYDDNVTFADKNEKDDFVTYAGAGLGMKYEGKTRTFELVGNVMNQSFAKNKDFDNVTEDVVVKFKNEFSAYGRLSLNNVFTHSEAPLFFSENFIEEQFGRTTGRFEYFKNRFNVDYTRDISKQITAIVRYDNYLDIFSGIDLQNSILNKIGLETNYLFSSSTIFIGKYDFINRQFEGGGDDATIHELTAGIRQYITRKLYFDERIGVDFIDSFHDENLTKPVIQASVSYQIDTDMLARLSFDKKYDTNPYTADIFNQWRTTASLTKQLLKRVGCSFSVFYGDGEYITSDFRQKLLGANTSLTYDITRNFKGNMAYTFSEANTNTQNADYTKNTLFFGVAAQF